jgi:hypothetical protein
VSLVPLSRPASAESWSRGSWLKASYIVDRISEPLLTAKVSFPRLNADMPEQKLDYFRAFLKPTKESMRSRRRFRFFSA